MTKIKHRLELHWWKDAGGGAQANRAPLWIPMVIGRDAECDLCLLDEAVSRQHLRLEGSLVSSDGRPGRVRIVDLGSANGTLLNGRSLVGRSPLVPGDRISVGPFRLELRLAQELEGDNVDGRNTSVLEIPPAPTPTSNRQRIRDIAETVRVQLREADLGNGESLERAIEPLLEEAIERAELPAETMLEVRDSVRAELLGLGPLEPLLREAGIDEIMVNGPNALFVERGGRIESLESPFSDAGEILRIIERIVMPLGRRIDEASPTVDARLRDGSRVHAVIPPLAIDGPILTIRKFGRRLLSSEDLVAAGSATQPVIELLSTYVARRWNILICGGTGSGKTTLLNVLSGFVPASERILTIEDAAELQLSQPHVVRLESRPANAEGAGSIPIRELVRNALRMRPDRLVVGECRGSEALDMLQAMNTGHDGSMTTVHANGPRDALARLETMSLMAGLGLSHRAIREQAVRAVHVVVHQERCSDGTRRIMEIAETRGLDGDSPLLESVVRYEPHSGCYRFLASPEVRCGGAAP